MTRVPDFLDRLRAELTPNTIVTFLDVMHAVERVFGTHMVTRVAEFRVLQRRYESLLEALRKANVSVACDKNGNYDIQFQRREDDHNCADNWMVVHVENNPFTGLVNGWEKCKVCGRERHFTREPHEVFGEKLLPMNSVYVSVNQNTPFIAQRVRTAAVEFNATTGMWPTHVVLGQKEYAELRDVTHANHIEYPMAVSGVVSIAVQRSAAASELRCDRLPPDKG